MAVKRKAIKKNAVLFFLYVLGYFLNIGPYLALCGLQSSINIEDSIGTMTLGIVYVVSFITGLFITPIVIRRFGCKYAFLFGDVGHLLFIAANFYPVRYVMIPTGVIVGFGEGMIWTAIAVYSSYFGAQHAMHGTRHISTYVRKYTGIFFGIYFAAQISGSMVAYGVLYGGKQEYIQNFSNDTSSFSNGSVLNNSFSYNITSTKNPTYETEPYKYCGANDCQDPDVTSSRINNYVLTKKKYLHILLAVFSASSIIGVIIHFFYLPVAKPEFQQSPGDDATFIKNKKRKEKSHSLQSTLQATYRHFINPLQLLLIPIVFYNGLFYGFYASELSRAFTSCILGVEQVGLTLGVFSISCAITSFLFPKIIGYFGRNKIIIMLLMIDLSNYIFCSIWKPRDSTTSLVYVIFVIFGITEACWKNTTLHMYNEYFPENQEIAFSAWNTCMIVGIAVSFCWSSLICVNVKIYIQCALLISATGLYGIAEYIHQPKKQLKESRNPSKSFQADVQ